MFPCLLKGSKTKTTSRSRDENKYMPIDEADGFKTFELEFEEYYSEADDEDTLKQKRD